MTASPKAVPETQVLVVGAGPVGLTTAISLARQGIRCTLIERADKVGILPKMDLSNARSMEIYGRLGLAEKIRNAGWPLDAKLDVYVGPNIVDRPYKVLRYPSILDMQARIAECSDGSMPREPYERIAQYNIEALFKSEAEAQENITVLYGHELTSFADGDEGIRATARTTGGNDVIISAAYLVGCDGGNSLVRRQLGVQLDGQSAVARMFMIFFRCNDLLQKTGLRAFRHYYIAGKRQAALLAQDDLKRWAVPVGNLIRLASEAESRNVSIL
jgi:2-polyprenyl-6-methoxyphenol hydroxylase-like FAD-dependent oxidoreductase